MWKGRKPRIANKMLNENKVRGLMQPDFKTHYETTINQDHVALVTEQIGQWSRTESPEEDPRKYSQLIVDKGQRQYNEANIGFSTNIAGTTVYPHAKKIYTKTLCILHLSQKST